MELHVKKTMTQGNMSFKGLCNSSCERSFASLHFTLITRGVDIRGMGVPRPPILSERAP